MFFFFVGQISVICFASIGEKIGLQTNELKQIHIGYDSFNQYLH